MSDLKKAFEEPAEETAPTAEVEEVKDEEEVVEEVVEEIKPTVRKQSKLDKIERLKDTPHAADVANGCFVRPIMHKGHIFQVGEKLDKKHPQYELLKKHIK